MAATTWQVLVGKKLSKHYTIEQLKLKNQTGAVSATTTCTDDNGATFTPLSKLLKDVDSHLAAQTSLRSGNGIRKHARAAGLRQTSTEILSDIDSPIVSGTNQPSQSGSADAILANLYSTSVAAVANSDDPTATEQDDAEVYRIPATPPVREFLDPKPSAVAQAAARALQVGQQQSQDTQDELNSLLPTIPTPTAGAKHSSSEQPGPVKTSSRSLRPLIAITVITGFIASAVLAWWFQGASGPPTFEELTGGAVAINDFRSDTPITIEELHARTQILGVQVGRLTRAVTALDGADVQIELVEPSVQPQSLSAKLPLLPFRQRMLTVEQQAKVEEFLSRYTQLIQDKGPDGRNLDDASVARTFTYLNYIIHAADSKGPERVTALFELSEWVKLVYLLELGRLKDGTSDQKQKAVADLLNSSNAGLEMLYPELQSGDMRFVDVFERSEAPEQSKLLLTRYWYHRALNRTAADLWLGNALNQIDESEHSTVKASIAEVDHIEQ